MPELAEVHYFARQWAAGMRRKVTRVSVHPQARVFRGLDTDLLVRSLPGRALTDLATHGKQMYFQFGPQCRLGIHLGMTGELSTGATDFSPGKSDHLVLYQSRQSLIFRDPRMFGRVRFDHGVEPADWWSQRDPGLLSGQFTLQHVRDWMQRRARLPLKGLLLQQKIFPGIGNWMADEILWRSRLHPQRLTASLTNAEQRNLWKTTRWVAAQAMARIGTDYGDLPKTWLFSSRWRAGGHCPRCQTALERREVSGRTTCWCPCCQVVRATS